MVRSNLNSSSCSSSSSLLLLLLFVPEMLLELIETFVPEPLVLMHPSRYFPKWCPSEGDEDLTPLLLPFNESSSFEYLEVLRHGV